MRARWWQDPAAGLHDAQSQVLLCHGSCVLWGLTKPPDRALCYALASACWGL